MDSIQDYAIFMLDRAGRVASWNSGAQRLKGYTEAQILGQHFSVFYLPEDLAAGKPAHELEVAAAVGRFEDEGWRLRRDGTRFWANVVITPLIGRDGTLRGFGKVTRDFSDRKHAQDLLRITNEALAQRTTELEAANAELEAYSYTVSHDLRAPIRSIIGNATLLAEDARDRLTPADAQLLSRVRATAEGMSRLVDDLLSLARLTRAPLAPEPVELATIAREIAEDLHHAHPHHPVVLTIPVSLPAAGDPQLLRVLLENLLRNAWKFTRYVAAPRIEVRVEELDGERVFVVEDNGVGFDEAFVGQLFRPFERLHSGTEFEGTGVGLATVARIVRRHGGRVGASGEPGVGARFWFTLPE